MEITFGGQKNSNDKNPNKKNIPVDNTGKDVADQVGNLSRRMRLLESSLGNVRTTVQNLEKNLVDSTKESKRDIRTLEEENNELKESIRLMKTTLKKIISDMQNTAKAEEVKVIQKYLELWNPVKFTTVEMSRRIAKDVFEENESIGKKIEKINQQKQNL